MRETTITSGQITINVTYPEDIVWLNDNFSIELNGPMEVGGQVRVEDPAGESYMLEYYSETDKLMFYLDDAIRALFGDNIGTWRCTVTGFHQGIPMGSFTFTFKVLSGKSFITRSHGISSTIYVYNPDELYKLQVYSPAAGAATCGQWGFNIYRGLNQVNLTSAIRQTGEYSLCIRDSNAIPPVGQVVVDIPVTPYKSTITIAMVSESQTLTVYGDDVYDHHKKIFPICHTIKYVEHCNDFSFGEIMYRDLDGMQRYLGGKVILDTDDVKEETYINTSLEIYKTNPNRYVKSHTKVIKLALNDIDKDAYPHDLIYSDKLFYRSFDGEWRHCSLKTTNLKREDETSYDLELEIIVSQ